MSSRYPQHFSGFGSTQGNFSGEGADRNSPLPRGKIFISVLTICLLTGFATLFFIDPIYQSRASLLLSAPKDIDRTSDEEDSQQIAIQQKILLSDHLLSEVVQRSKQAGDYSILSGERDLTLEQAVGILRTEAIEGTNLLDLIAEGDDPDLLTHTLGYWIRVYLEYREKDIKDNYQLTTNNIESELAEINQRIETARNELNTYREKHQIVSAEREENEALSKMRGINASMNTANEEVIKAKSHLDDVMSQNQEGGNLVPKSQQEYVNDLNNRLTALRSRLAILEKQYTREYIKLKPELRGIPEDIQVLEQELSTIYAKGKKLAIAEARQEYERTLRVARNLEQELQRSKSQARAVTAIFAKHQSLVTDLAELEQLHRDALTRLAQLEAKQLDKLPQMTVIAEPSLAIRIWPNYLLASAAIIGGSLAIALFVVWLISYLQNRQQPGPTPINGIYIYPNSPYNPEPNQASVTFQGNANAALELDNKAQESKKALDKPENDPDR